MNLNKWLKEHICQSENGTIFLSDIQKKIRGNATSQEIGRAMTYCFPGTVCKSVRDKEYWAKRTKQYFGVCWLPVTSSPTGVDLNENIVLSYENSNAVIKSPESSTSEKQKDIQLVKSDHNDMCQVLKSVCKDTSCSQWLHQLGVSEKMKTMLTSQLENCAKSSKSRRWDKSIIRLCLTLYCRSPKNYEFLRQGGYLTLPSSKLIQKYKNKVEQKTGINIETLEWMKNEAEMQGLSAEGYEGGLILDEMSLQDDLQLKRKGDEFELIGFVECCPESSDMNSLMGISNLKLATHALQLLFLGHSGFRFPFAHFATVQTSPSELYLIFWKAVKMLSLYGFHVTYLSLDGAQSNRVLMKMFLPENKRKSDSIQTMLFSNVFDPTMPKISVIMDFSHVMKKIRNNLSKSGNSQNHKKLLQCKGKFIIWEHWYKAYQWDTSTNTFKVYPQLTQDHFFLNSQLTMRNKLAEAVLNKDMLHLMQLYCKSLGEKGDELTASIELLKNTSVLIKNFRDNRPITSSEDSRLIENKCVLQWFREWENSEKKGNTNNSEKRLISFQTREDIVSLLLGFDSLCTEKFKKSAGSIIPSRINSDVIENIFSQQRGIHNGTNTNPDYLTYCRTMNAIILGETSISRKSNTGGSSGAVPFQTTEKKQPLKTSSFQNINM